MGKDSKKEGTVEDRGRQGKVDETVLVCRRQKDSSRQRLQ